MLFPRYKLWIYLLTIYYRPFHFPSTISPFKEINLHKTAELKVRLAFTLENGYLSGLNLAIIRFKKVVLQHFSKRIFYHVNWCFTFFKTVTTCNCSFTVLLAAGQLCLATLISLAAVRSIHNPIHNCRLCKLSTFFYSSFCIKFYFRLTFFSSKYTKQCLTDRIRMFATYGVSSRFGMN